MSETPVARGRFRVAVGVVPGARLKTGPQVALTSVTAAKVLADTPEILANQGVTVQAPSTNTHSIWVGGSDVTDANGIELQAGQSVSIPVDDPSHVWAYATTSGQKVGVSWV